MLYLSNKKAMGAFISLRCTVVIDDSFRINHPSRASKYRITRHIPGLSVANGALWGAQAWH